MAAMIIFVALSATKINWKHLLTPHDLTEIVQKDSNYVMVI